MDNIYEVIIGPPALPYPEQKPEPTPPATHRRLAIILAMLGAAIAIAAALLALWWINRPPNASDTTTVITPTIVPVDPGEPPTVRWVIPDIEDADIASVDTRYVAVLARHNVGPTPEGGTQGILDIAHQICAVLANGFSQQQVQDALLSSKAGLSQLQVKVVTVTAIELYCPTQH